MKIPGNVLEHVGVPGAKRGVVVGQHLAIYAGHVGTTEDWQRALNVVGAKTVDKNNLGQPENVAAAVAYLASDAAAFV